MKKIYLFLAFFIVAQASSIGQIATFNMENWTTFLGGTNPNGWASANILTNNSTVVQDAVVKHSGSYSAKVVTGVISPNPLSAYMPDTSGFMLTGTLNVITQQIQQGFPYTTRADTLGVWARHNPQSSDQGFIYVTLSKWNALGTSQRDTLASGTFVFSGADPGFVFRRIGLDYTSFGLPASTMPDTAFIIVSSSKRIGAQPGSQLWVDDFEWDPASGVGMQEKVLASFDLYPSPAQTEVFLNMNLFSGKKTLTVFDLTGRLVLQNSTLESKTMLDVAFLPNGIYQVLISDEQGLTGTERLTISGK